MHSRMSSFSFQTYKCNRLPEVVRSSLPTSVHTSHVQLAHALVQYLGASSPQELEPFGIRSSGELVDLISKVSSQNHYVNSGHFSRCIRFQFATNTHSLTTSNLTPIGLAVSPLLALVNHSCNPNAVLVFPSLSKPKDEPAMHLVCLQEIKPGDEVCSIGSTRSLSHKWYC